MIQRLKSKFFKEKELTEEEVRVRSETMDMMRQMILKEVPGRKKKDMDFITDAKPNVEETIKSKETRKGMDFILDK